jgi:hypothetical protein
MSRKAEIKPFRNFLVLNLLKIKKEVTIMTKIKKSICILGISGIFSFILLNMTAHAGEPIDCTVCYNSTITPIVESSDLTIMGTESKGIVLDNTKSKFFDSSTAHSVGVLKIEKGKVITFYSNKFLDPSGDFYVLEGTQVGAESEWKFIYGTGKFKGISGGGTTVRITKGKPVSQGTSQYCVKVTGTYELKQ